MAKQRIDATIDMDIYLRLKTMEINSLSELINGFLGYYVENEESNPSSKLKIELKKLEKQEIKIKEKIAMIKFNLNNKKEKISKEEEKDKKKRIEHAVQLAKGIKASGILHED